MKGEPQPLEYLRDEEDQASGGLDVQIRVSVSTRASRDAGTEAMPLSLASTRTLFWTAAQMVAHHTSNGCNLRAGDVLATGTVSGAEISACGMPAGEDAEWCGAGRVAEWRVSGLARRRG